MKRRPIASLALLLATIAPSAMAADITWSGATNSDWQEATNWIGGVVPGAIDRAFINIIGGPVINGVSPAAVSELRLGSGGSTNMRIENGGALASASNSYLAYISGSSSLVITGTGSKLTSGGGFSAGHSGNGTLMVENGGALSAAGFQVGVGGTSTSTATVTGTNSTVASSSFLNVGNLGSGTLNVRDGGAVSAAGTLSVGNIGTGVLMIENGGTVNGNGNMYLGVGAGATGSATVTGTGSTLTSGGELRVGGNGTGTLTIASGGKASSAATHSTVIGYSGGSTGTVSVKGAGSSIASGSDLTVGNAGNGTLNIENGGAASSGINIHIGAGAASISTATVTGENSTLISGGSLSVGSSGTGTLTVSNGGMAQSAGALRIAMSNGSTGTVNIGAAAGDAAVAAGVIDAANIQFGAGTGKIVFNHTDDDYTLSSSISGAGTVDVLSGTTTLSGANGGFTGTINIRDGTLQASNTLGGVTTGATTITNGTYNILNGAVVNNAGGSIGSIAGSNGTASVSGAGSQWINNGELRIGNYGSGTLTVQDGGKAESTINAYIGNLAGSNSTATVSGTGSSLKAGNNLIVGHYGTGTLTVENGGKAESTGHVALGYNDTGVGTATVTGAGSLLKASMNLYVARGSILTVKNGGTAESTFSTYIGATAGSAGTAIVSGSGSMLNSLSDLRVGDYGNGTLTVEDGGKVESANIAYIATLAGSTGTVMVSGAGSTMNSKNDLRVGNQGTGTLTVSNSGTVQSTGIMHIARLGGSTGTLNIGAAAGEAAVAAGMIDAANIQFGAGTGKIVFNHTDDDYTLYSNISGAGVMDFLAGTSVLTGNNNGFTGIVNVDGGILRVNGVMGALATTVETGARFEGNASIGNLIVNSGGTLAPGNSIGVTNTVNATFNPGSIYDVELNAVGQNDVLAATGVVTINGGTVHVIPYPDYALGTPYTIITAAGGVAGGGFDALTSAAPYVTGSLVYNPNDVQLVLSATPDTLVPAAQTHNQRGVARAAANVSGNAAIGALLFSPDAASARHAMDQLSGEIHAILTAAQIREQEALRMMVLRRKPDAQVDAGQSSVWMQAFGSFGQSGSDSNAATLDTVSGGAMIGVESRTEHGYLGAGIGHSVQQIDVDARHSDASARNYHALVYGGGRIAQTGIELDGGASLTWHDNETRRDVRIGTFSGASAADYHGQSGQVFARVGYRFEGAETTVKPYVEGAYVHHHASGYRESGIAGLKGSASNANAGFATLGIEAERGVALNDEGARIVLTGGLGWRHLIGGENVEKRHSWDGAANSDFTVRGVQIERDAVLFDAGVSADLAPGVTAGIAYSGSLGADSLYHAVSARAGISF